MSEALQQKVKIETLEIEGMHCASCVSAVEKSLAHLAGVEQASVNLATESATVKFDSSKVDFGQLRKAVQDAGYEVAIPVQKLTFKVEGMHCASCVASVEKALQGVDGVSEAEVNLATESAMVSYDASRVKRPPF